MVDPFGAGTDPATSERPPVVAGLHRLATLFRRPQAMALLPGVTLGAYFVGGESWLIATSLALPLGVALIALTGPPGLAAPRRMVEPPTSGRPLLVARLGDFLALADGQEQRTACMVLVIDDAPALRDRHGPAGWDLLFQRSLDRTRGALREGDVVAALDATRIAVALAPGRRMDLESVLQVGARLQDALAAPISLDAVAVHVTASVGFCLASRAPGPGAKALLTAAEAAGEHARRYGPSALRAFTPEVAAAEAGAADLRAEVAGALAGGQIVAYFQPQVSTDTGAVTGFEALARWLHPRRGLIPPGDFLPLIESCGLSDRLGEVIRTEALRALAAWDRAGHKVPTVAVNFSTAELRDPHLPDRISWELDRHDLRPGRLTVEILESVAAGAEDDVIVRNLSRLAAMGCGIDLDDFGTGQAGIANIRRFGVRRLKIDRSFVRQIDQDRDQQAVVAGILSLAERLGLDTVGEGVETAGEHAVLAQLSCGHVQGFAIARPMPLADTLPWLQNRVAEDGKLPGLRVGRKGS
jgi:diguanylate cyclase